MKLRKPQCKSRRRDQITPVLLSSVLDDIFCFGHGCGSNGDVLGRKSAPLLNQCLGVCIFVFQKDVGDFTTKSKADEVYQEKKSFEVDNLKGVELDVEVYDAHLGEKTVSASFTGAKELSGATHHFLLGSCKVKLGDHGITDDPKGIKVPLSNTFKSSGAEIYLIFTLNLEAFLKENPGESQAVPVVLCVCLNELFSERTRTSMRLLVRLVALRN
eukprot:CAMPEP_0178722968 /NCGR_PEP_ID=MMETSP0699-20121125/25292_1 /TAXON_ID=265572 /ORGANISM="Extubocellulus spinifer, Strain CCMP396" /LENGTH=214 /DNA_ID=CAMNT_0020374009 /DNA_START=106 /DNA_END=752 /DNA_ORIENTATION=+